MNKNPFCPWLAALVVTASLLSRLGSWAQAVPHHFSDISVLPDRTAMLSLDGSVSNIFPNLPVAVSNQVRQMFDLYPVEASTDLADWTRLALLLRTNNDSNPLTFQDTNAPDLSQRFYRTFTNHQVTGFPRPTGPYSVGTFSHVLTDPSRSNRYGLPTNSSFMSTFWYPTEPPGAGCLPGAYTDAAVATDRAFYTYWSFPYQWTSAVPHFVTHAIANVAVVAGTNRFPVILHSHGYTCDRRLNAHVAEELASHGYIVAAVDHEDCHATVYPDARGVRYVPPGTYTDAAAGIRSRTNDLQCLLGALSQMNSSDPVLAGRLDLEHVGVTGFSFGGQIAAEACRADSRVKCAALLDGWFNFSLLPALNTQGLQKPFITMNRTLPLPNFSDFSPFSERLFTLATTNATWLKIANTKHFHFSDWAWSVDLTADSRPGAAAMDACLWWFFDTYLKGQTPPFPTNPPLINVQRK